MQEPRDIPPPTSRYRDAARPAAPLLPVRTRDSMATAGMVLGIIACVLVLIPFLGLVALPLSLIGLPLAGATFFRARKYGLGLGVPIAGAATNPVAFVLWFAIAAAFVAEIA
jgi:hypothetical protein